MTSVANVELWGRRIGAVALGDAEQIASFQYDPGFAEQDEIQLSPLVMPTSTRVYRFPELPMPAFRGLPGLLADSLPDRFGNALIDTWLARQGRAADSFNAVERLCYTGTRGMGALEYHPALGPRATTDHELEVSELVQLASDVLSERDKLVASLRKGSREEAMRDILRVGTSAGGARAKAVIAWNPNTGEVRSGQVQAGSEFEPWIIKFDGVTANRDKELADPQGFGAIEYSYSLMARAAGIEMMETRLLEENGRRHFMTRRFDRTQDRAKLHMLTLGGLRHYDLNLAGGYSHEQALQTIKELGLDLSVIEQQYRRMVFNIVARNQDDHVKNIAFLMNRQGEWSLSPAYDLAYSYNPTGEWTSRHQMTANGKRDGFTVADLTAVAEVAGMKRGRDKTIQSEVRHAVSHWLSYAQEAGVNETRAEAIAQAHRLELPTG
jgi:serine/threonine-protein kinase HipA